MIPPRCTVNNNLNASGPVDLADAVDIRSKDNTHRSYPLPRTEKVWHLLPSDSGATQRLATAAKVAPVVAQLLLNREVIEPVAARRFLDAPLAGLHPPLALPGVVEAADRIAKAVVDRRKICVYGDYDVDGVTGTAILLELLNRLGADVEFHTPLRLSEGYGLNAEQATRTRAVRCVARRERRLRHRKHRRGRGRA